MKIIQTVVDEEPDNPGYMEFNVNGNIYTHDSISYQSNLNFKRVDMPQIGVYELLKNDMYKHLIKNYGVGVVHTVLPINLLKPTQIDIDYDRVRIDIAKYGWDDKFQRPLLISNDFRIVDGHHQHVRWMITQPERITEVLMVDMPILELIPWLKDQVIPYFNITKSIPESFEDDFYDEEFLIENFLTKGVQEHFGMQGPEAVPGMGSVQMPEIVTAGNEMSMSGSGDIPGNTNFSINKKKDEEELSVEEAIVLLNNQYNENLINCQNLFALELDNSIMEALDKTIGGNGDENYEAGQQLIAELKSRVSNFLGNLGFKYTEEGKLARYCKDSEGNESWVVSESMGDISSEHKYYSEFGGYFTPDEVESGHALQCRNNTHKPKFFTRGELAEIARKHREENGADWLEKLREEQKLQRIQWKADKITEIQSGKNLEQKYGMLSIGDSIVNLASSIFAIHQIDISDELIRFVHKEIQDTKDFINSPIDENLNEAKDKQIPLEVHFKKDDVATMEDLITCMNKPVKRRFKIIDTEFSCQTLEGITHGKAGDCLVVGVDGEIYPCDKKIFDDTYVSLHHDKIQEELLNVGQAILNAKSLLEQVGSAYIAEKISNINNVFESSSFKSTEGTLKSK